MAIGTFSLVLLRRVGDRPATSCRSREEGRHINPLRRTPEVRGPFSPPRPFGDGYDKPAAGRRTKLTRQAEGSPFSHRMVVMAAASRRQAWRTFRRRSDSSRGDRRSTAGFATGGGAESLSTSVASDTGKERQTSTRARPAGPASSLKPVEGAAPPREVGRTALKTFGVLTTASGSRLGPASLSAWHTPLTGKSPKYYGSRYRCG